MEDKQIIELYFQRNETAISETAAKYGAFCQKIAMNILKSRLYQKQVEEKQKQLDALRGEQKNIEWGSQIRSYVFCPYTLVKDHRSLYETSDVHGVLEGDLDDAIYSYLKWEVK